MNYLSYFKITITCIINIYVGRNVPGRNVPGRNIQWDEMSRDETSQEETSMIRNGNGTKHPAPSKFTTGKGNRSLLVFRNR